MNINITTSAKSDSEGLALLRQMGMPFAGSGGGRQQSDVRTRIRANGNNRENRER